MPVKELNIFKSKTEELDASVDIERCAICGMPLTPSQMVYKEQDDTYVHEQCKIDSISEYCVEWSEVLEAEEQIVDATNE